MKQYLSSPLSAIKSTYDVVVIGSGYGGSIAASRLSRANRSVCVLERGRELQPGDYPEDLQEGQAEMQINTETATLGHQNGLFNFHVHNDISVLVGCGLGGTSLINANVSIQPEPWVFEDKSWPEPFAEEFRDPESLLHAGYNRARDMLKPNPFPASGQLNKLKALEQSAEMTGGTFSRTDINVNFDIDGLNHVGVPQRPCVSCGNCCSGCNFAAKNTVLMNYLPDAVAFGARIFTEAGVESIKKEEGPDGKIVWNVCFRNLNPEASEKSIQTITANMVVLAAGTLGSTEILLRSKAKGLAISDQLGKSFSGNGDMLGFGYNTEVKVDGVGALKTDQLPDPAPGPCITGIIDIRDKPDRENGMVIQDAVIPGVLARLVPASLFIARKLIGVKELAPKDDNFFGRLKRLRRQRKSLRKGGAYQGAVEHTQTYLVMAHDGSDGSLSLNKNGRLTIEWKGIGNHPIFNLGIKTLRAAVKALSGIFIKNPYFVNAEKEYFSAENILLQYERADKHGLTKLQHTPLSVHPLGGCSMGSDSLTGVVNERGQVFNTQSTVSVYENLYVVDGAIIPRSLGVNPLLTISALAERACALMARDRGWEIYYGAGPSAFIFPKTGTEAVGIAFSENMGGRFTTNDQVHQELLCSFNIHCDDVDKLIADNDHRAEVSGQITSPFFGAGPIPIFDGVLNLLIDSVTHVDKKLMNYRFSLLSAGQVYSIYGVKEVFRDQLIDEVKQTSVLFVTVYEGSDNTGAVIGKGEVEISVAEIAKMLGTIRAVNADTEKEALKAVAKFGTFFSRSLFEIYGGIFAPLEYFDSEAPPRKKRPLNAGLPKSYDFCAGGTWLRLTRYEGGTKGPLLMTHGFSGNRLTFAIDTIEQNPVEYFFANGYDVWLLDFRTSTLLDSSHCQHTVDDLARYDYPAAIEKMLQVTGKPEVHVFAHCLGSMALFMALLRGMKGVRSVVCAQNAAYFEPNKEVKWKAGFHVPELLHLLGIKSLTAYAERHANWKEKLYDRLLNLYAEGVAEYCNNPTCHRLTFMFGPLSEHDNLNAPTHTALLEMFGVANIQTFEHLTTMVREGQLTDSEGKDVYLPHLSDLKMPITFIHGEKNALFLPAGTAKTYRALCELNGPEKYMYHLIPEYGHNDCMYGKNAIRDVFHYALDHFEKWK